MKKILLSLFVITGSAYAAPWDLNIGQYDQFGTSIINRLTPLPSGSVSGIVTYNVTANLPKLATVDSTLTISSGNVIGISTSTLSGLATTSALATGLATKFDAPIGSTAQYLRGDGSLATFPAIPVSLSLTTTGTSGAATYNGGTGVLNVPNYATGTGTVTSVGLTSSNLTITGSPITTSGNLTVALPNVGTAGNYDAVTTDAQGRVSAGTNRSQSAQTRTLNSGYQISATRASFVVYSVRIATTASIGGNQDGDVILEIASDSGFTTNVQTLSITQNAQAISLAIVLNSVQTQTGVLTGYVPAGYYARLRTVNNTGTPNFQFRSGQEVLL